MQNNINIGPHSITSYWLIAFKIMMSLNVYKNTSATSERMILIKLVGKEIV